MAPSSIVIKDDRKGFIIACFSYNAEACAQNEEVESARERSNRPSSFESKEFEKRRRTTNPGCTLKLRTFFPNRLLNSREKRIPLSLACEYRM